MLEEAKAMGIPEYDVKYRCTGASTGRALCFIGDCLMRPGEPVKVFDHYDTYRSHQYLLDTCGHLVAKLELEGFVFNKSYNAMVFQLDPSKEIRWSRACIRD